MAASVAPLQAGEFMKSSPDELVQVKKGSSTPSEVVIRDMDQFDMHLWLEMYDPPADDALEILGSVCGPLRALPGGTRF